MNCNKPFTTVSASELDIDDLATPVDFFLGIRTVENPSTGTTVNTPVRVPGEKVLPTGTLANVVALTTNNTALSIPEHQVRAGYLDAQPGGNVMKYADATHTARFLMVSEYINGKMLIQSTGFLNLPEHQYIPLVQYYVGENGLPTTDNTSGQKLFVPLDDATLLVNGEF